MGKIVEIKNITKEFKVRTNKNVITGLFSPKNEIITAVDTISFDVKEGESLAFLGPNGAGKTTTTKMLSGLMYPTSGEISVLGFTPFDRKKEFLMQIGLVMGSKSGLNWDLTPTQSFKLLKMIYNIEDRKFKKTLNDLCDLLDAHEYLETQVRKLSLGERMKVELIGAILHSPKVLFLDEPTIGLDITARKNIRKFLRNLQKESNITLILTSHDMDDVEDVCDRVVIINKGQKVYDDNLNTLVQDYSKNKYLRVFFEKTPTRQQLSWLKNGSIEEHTSESVLFEIPKEHFPEFISRIVSDYDVLDIDVVGIPLEDIIEDVFKQEVTTLRPGL